MKTLKEYLNVALNGEFVLDDYYQGFTVNFKVTNKKNNIILLVFGNDISFYDLQDNKLASFTVSREELKALLNNQALNFSIRLYQGRQWQKEHNRVSHSIKHQLRKLYRDYAYQGVRNIYVHTLDGYCVEDFKRALMFVDKRGRDWQVFFHNDELYIRVDYEVYYFTLIDNFMYINEVKHLYNILAA